VGEASTTQRQVGISVFAENKTNSCIVIFLRSAVLTQHSSVVSIETGEPRTDLAERRQEETACATCLLIGSYCLCSGDWQPV
jgi:hypothetical protein